MIVLSGADLVLPDRVLTQGTLVIEGDRIADIRSGTAGVQASTSFALHNHYVVPGFIDVHVHGVDGVDAQDDGNAVAAIAAALPRYGVTAFCPTTIACSALSLRRVLDQVCRARADRSSGSARVLPAHLESNFINPEFRGAQPLGCLFQPRDAFAGLSERISDEHAGGGAADVIAEITRAAADVGIVTLAPELDGAIELIHWLVTRGHRVSLGHSGSTCEEALAAVAAGASQATHLFNRMPPLNHRAPGLAGAVLQAEEVAAELICDGVHVHPAMLRMAIAAKRPSRILAITDGTAAAGISPGAPARLGGQVVTGNGSAAWLSDGTLAGSIATMDRVFRTLVEVAGMSLVDAVTMCSTTPAREMGMPGYGLLAAEATADLVVLDGKLSVVQVYIDGQLAYRRSAETV